MACKADLVAIVAGKLDISKVATAEIVAEVLNAITTLTADGDRLALLGFGSFVKKTSAARTGRNPQTGAPLEIAAKTKLTFKASK